MSLTKIFLLLCQLSTKNYDDEANSIFPNPCPFSNSFNVIEFALLWLVFRLDSSLIKNIPQNFSINVINGLYFQGSKDILFLLK